jgi:hypothetical protein
MNLRNSVGERGDKEQMCRASEPLGLKMAILETKAKASKIKFTHYINQNYHPECRTSI